jgi:Uncharacterized protein conserved in bacteria (DUF2344)
VASAPTGCHPRQTSIVPEPAEPPVRHPAVPTREPVQRWRLVLRRDRLGEEQVQRAQQSAWEAGLRSSGLPIVGLGPDTGRPRFAMAAPLAPSTPGEAELADVWLTERLARWKVRAALAGVVPDGTTLVDLYDVWLGEPPLPGQVVASVYRGSVTANDSESTAIEGAVSTMIAADTILRERRRGDRAVASDLRPFIDELAATRRAGDIVEIRMVLRHDPEKGVGRPDEVLAELADRSGVSLDEATLVRERLVLVADRPSWPPARG